MLSGYLFFLFLLSRVSKYLLQPPSHLRILFGRCRLTRTIPNTVCGHNDQEPQSLQPSWPLKKKKKRSKYGSHILLSMASTLYKRAEVDTPMHWSGVTPWKDVHIHLPILEPSRLTRNAVAHGGNIMAEIRATKIMERREPVRANAWKAFFGRGYGVHFTMYEAISTLQPPSDAGIVPPQQSRKTNVQREDSPEFPGGQPSSPPVETHETTRAAPNGVRECTNVLFNLRQVLPWCHRNNRNRRAHGERILQSLIDDWEANLRRGAGGDFWSRSDTLTSLNQGTSWYWSHFY